MANVRLTGLELDHRGISAVMLGPEVTGMVTGVANQIAAHARSGAGRRATVTVQHYVARGGRLLGNRSAASVIVRGAGLEAKFGVLSQAAAALGLQVRGR